MVANLTEPSSYDVSSIRNCLFRGKAVTEYYATGNALVLIFTGYALPIIALLGTIGNVLSLYVLLQPQMRKSSMNIALIGLSTCVHVLSMFFFHCAARQWLEFLRNVNSILIWKWWLGAIFYPLVKIGTVLFHLIK